MTANNQQLQPSQISAMVRMTPTPAQAQAYYERILGDRIKSRRGDQVQVLCTMHEDRSPSLSVNLANGRWTCFAGCGQGDAFSFEMKRTGCSFPEAKRAVLGEPERKTVKKYNYVDETGSLLYQVLRFDPKGFSQRRPDGNGGWARNLNGTRRVPYRLPEVIAADTVFLPEGEGDCDRLASLGLTASTNSGGGGKWRNEFSRYFAGKRIIILPDNDSLGQDHAQKVAHNLHGVAANVKVLSLPGLPDKGDVSDWLDTGHYKEELLDLVEKAPTWDPQKVSAQYKKEVWAERKIRFRTAAEVAQETPTEVDWICPPWVARGSITELAGKIKAAGKTTWLTHLSRAVADGNTFMGQQTSKTSVVYLTEQPPASFRAALERASLLDHEDFIVLFWHETLGNPWQVVVNEAVQECRRRGAGLLVVDTIGQFANLRGDSENDAGAALQAMKPLQEAAASGLAVMVVRHERKSGGEVGDSGRGSSAFAGAVDIVLSIRRPEGNTRPELREIHALSRFNETPPKLVIELTDHGYLALGEPHAVEAPKAEEAILAIAPQTEGDAVAQDDLIKASEVKRSTGQRAIRRLIQDEKLDRVGSGKRGDPYRFWTPGKDSAQTRPLYGRKEIEQDQIVETVL